MADAVRPLTQYLELAPADGRRRFLIAIPALPVLARRDRRLAELRLDPAAAAADPSLGALGARIAASALAEASDAVAGETVARLVERLGLRCAVPPSWETLAALPGAELLIRAEVAALTIPEPPDPAGLVVERLRAAPDPAPAAEALAALAASRAAWTTLPPNAPAARGDRAVVAIEARLAPPANRLPQPGLVGAIPGALAGGAGRLPEGWGFGDNGSGMAAAVLAVAGEAQPPHLRLRISGSARADGQSYLLFQPPGGIPASPGSTWAGSVAVRMVPGAIGLRGAKLRLDSQPAQGRGVLRRKDAAVTPAAGGGFARCYVAESLADPMTGSVRLVLLFDHARGAVDFIADIAEPRLLEGLDLGQRGALPLAAFSAPSRRLAVGAQAGPAEPDPLGLGERLEGHAAGAVLNFDLRLPSDLPDRALAGQAAAVTLRVLGVERRAPPALDDAFAAALGFADLAALNDFVAQRAAERLAALEARQFRRALADALLAAAPPCLLPEAAVRAEAVRLGAGAASREMLMARAERRLRLSLLVEALAARHGIRAAESDFAAAAAAEPGASPERLQQAAIEEAVFGMLAARARVTERLVDAATLAAAAAE
jgi:FKBP-type peptidyl-prolyl cis-trans isomerase (trigger factor)